MALQLNALDGSFAQALSGIELWDDIEALAVPLRAAFAQHPVLVFRKQCLSSDQLMELGRVFGTPMRYIEKSWWSTRPEISIVSNMRNGKGEPIGGLSSRELNWHTDQSYNAVPTTGCYLYAQVVPDTGGETCWANLYGAYDSLPPELARLADRAVGTFSYAARTHAVIPNANAATVQQSYAQRIRETPDVKHSLVHTNPSTGRKALYIDPGTLIAIDGMSDTAGADFMQALFEYTTRPSNIYRHHWQLGDLVLWDNAATLHQRDPFPDEQCRLLKRMIIELPNSRHIVPALVE
jgi:taurine dioxygenase